MLKVLSSIKFFQRINNIFITKKAEPMLVDSVNFLLLPLRIVAGAIGDLETEPAIADLKTEPAIAVVETEEEIKNKSANDEAIDIPNQMQYKLLEEMLENKSLFLDQDYQKIEVEGKDIEWFGSLTDDINTWDYNVNRLFKIGFCPKERMIIVGDNGCKDGGAAIPMIIRQFSEALLYEVNVANNAATTTKAESTTTTAIAPTTKAESTTTTAIAPTTKAESTPTEQKVKEGKGKTTIAKKKEGFHCDRKYALSGVSPWVNARLTNVFNSIDDYPQDFNKDRQRMATGLNNWRYQQKYRLTTIDVKKIDYVIECLS